MQQLVFILLSSTRQFVINHTQNPDNAEAYLFEAIDIFECFKSCHELKDMENHLLNRMVRDIGKKDGWFSNRQKFVTLAQQHALDIVQSIGVRFGDGNLFSKV